MFWLLALLLAALAGAFILWPFFFSRRAGRSGGFAAVARALYRQRLGELDDEARTGILELDERAELEDELGHALLKGWAAEETGAATATPEDEPRSFHIDSGSEAAAQALQPKPGYRTLLASGRLAGRGGLGWAWLATLIAVPLFATVLYLRLGEPDAEKLAQAAGIMRLDPAADRIEMDRWRAVLSERVQAQPTDAGSWFLLGHLYMVGEDYAAAAAAFERAQRLPGSGASVDSYWLQARYLAAGGRLDEGGRKVAERILVRTPNDPTALQITALDAYQRGDFRAAVDLSNRALSNPLDPTHQALLQVIFDRARVKLGELTPAVEVRLSATVSPPKGASLFVIARPPGGGMPYAVVRRPASVLPQTIRLDDAVAMNLAMPLTSADALEVVARISLTGLAMKHPGDWEWRSQALSLADAAVVTVEAELSPPKL